MGYYSNNYKQPVARRDEEGDKRFKEWFDKWKEEHMPVVKTKSDDFDRSDEARERDEADFDSYIDDAYENMMTGGE